MANAEEFAALFGALYFWIANFSLFSIRLGKNVKIKCVLLPPSCNDGDLKELN
jgi:hypothetical protein